MKSYYLIVFSLLLFSPLTVYGATWFDEDWTYNKAIFVDADEVSGTLTNFPVLVNITDTDLRDKANINDIFFTDVFHETKFDHEIEHYDSSIGWLVAWVELPSINDVDDFQFYMYYNDTGSNGPQENVTGTWDGYDYEGVYHLHDDFLDSTGNGNDGTNTGSTFADGQVANGTSFDGINDFVQLNNQENMAYNYTDAFSVSFWTSRNNIAETDGIVMKSIGTGSTQNGWYCFWNAAGKVICEFGNGVADWAVIGGSNEDTGDPVHITMTYDGSENQLGMCIWEDGVFDSCGTDQNSTGSMVNTQNVTFGANALGGNLCECNTIDEVRIYNYVVSQDWIETKYRNEQNATSNNFIYLGNERTVQPNKDTIYLRINAPSSTVMGGVMLTDCGEHQVKGINGSGQIECNTGEYLFDFLAVDEPGVTNSIVCVDTELSVPLEINSVYILSGALMHTSTTTADFRWCWGIQPSWFGTSAKDGANALTGSLLTELTNGYSGATRTAHVTAIIHTNTDAGLLTVQYAQATADPVGTTTLVDDSWIFVRKVG